MSTPREIDNLREGNRRVRDAHKLIYDEMQRAGNYGLELRWEPIREALVVLELGAGMKARTEQPL